MSPERLAWAAGLYEGEGCLTYTPGGGIHLKITMCDEDVLRRFEQVVGVGSVAGPYPPSGLGKKDRWHYSASGQTAVDLARALYPLLLSRRQGQIDNKIKAWEERPLKGKGRKLTPSQAREIKRRLDTPCHGLVRSLAREFGVTDGMISSIKMGRAWAWVTLT